MGCDQSNVVCLPGHHLGPVALGTMDAASPAPEDRLLVTEALALEAQHGKNAYSDYVLKHRRRPSSEEAAGIGRRVGGQVMADDGTMQPPLTQGERAALKEMKARRRAASRRYDQIIRLRQAIAALAANKDDPSDVIGSGSCLLRDSAISEDLQAALCWLNRFATEWYNREEETRARG